MSEQTMAEFLDQATRFLDTAAGRAPAATSRPWGEGPDGTELLAEWSSEEEARLVTEARRFKALEYDAGFGWIDGPAVYGGRGLPRSYHEAYARLRGAVRGTRPGGHAAGPVHDGADDPRARHRAGQARLPAEAAPR